MKSVLLTALAGLGAVALVANAPAARASTVYDNTAATSNGADPISSFGPLADSFTTGLGGFVFNDLKLLLQDPTPSDGGSIAVSLLNDNSNNPGSLVQSLGTILDSSLTTSLGLIDLAVSPSVNLAASTTYWIELSQGSGAAAWSWSNDTSGPGVGGGFFYNQNGVISNESGPYQMAVLDSSGVAAVPEPGSFALLGVALVGIGLAASRRRRPA